MTTFHEHPCRVCLETFIRVARPHCDDRCAVPQDWTCHACELDALDDFLATLTRDTHDTKEHTHEGH